MEDENEVQKHPRLKATIDRFMQDEQYSLTESIVLEEMAYSALRDIEHKQNVGINLNRLEHNDREKAFHDQWLKENDPLLYINYGNGILQDLFLRSERIGLGADTCIHKINQRDREIVATVIQWLGSNIGMCFLEESLKRCGYKITQLKKDD